MARPIWNGTLSFGLLNIPVALMSGERRTDLSFRMLDARDNAPIRYERVNAETGEEVPWKEIVKAFEYDKGSYVVLETDDIRSAAPESHDAIDVESFVDADEVGPQYFEKPYVLVPGKKHVNIRGIEPIGNYAVQLQFDDGHYSGIFSWSLLHELGREYDVRWASYLAELEKRGASREPGI